MRKWSHLPPVELHRSPFKYEFRALQLRALRRHSLNFEMSAEPRLETSRSRADIVVGEGLVDTAGEPRGLAVSIG